MVQKINGYKFSLINNEGKKLRSIKIKLNFVVLMGRNLKFISVIY